MLPFHFSNRSLFLFLRVDILAIWSSVLIGMISLNWFGSIMLDGSWKSGPLTISSPSLAMRLGPLPKFYSGRCSLCIDTSMLTSPCFCSSWLSTSLPSLMLSRLTICCGGWWPKISRFLRLRCWGTGFDAYLRRWSVFPLFSTHRKLSQHQVAICSVYVYYLN